jgi:hypothetical protein
VARDGGTDVAGFRVHVTDGQGVVGLLDFAARELAGEGEVGCVVLGYDEAAAGIFVEAVNDAGAGDAADAAQFAAAVVEQGVDEGAVLVAGRRVDDEAGRFVEDEQAAVLVEDLKGDGLGLGFEGPGWGPMDLDAFPAARGVCGFDRSPVDAEMAVVD